MSFFEILSAVLGLILTTVVILYTIANRSKTRAENFGTLWERIDTLDNKVAALISAISSRDEFIAALQRRIVTLEDRLRTYGVPLPVEGNTQPIIEPVSTGLAMKRRWTDRK